MSAFFLTDYRTYAGIVRTGYFKSSQGLVDLILDSGLDKKNVPGTALSPLWYIQ